MEKLTTYLELMGLLLLGGVVPSGALALLPLAAGLPLALLAAGAHLLGCSAVLNGWRPPKLRRPAQALKLAGRPPQPNDQSKVPRVVSL